MHLRSSDVPDTAGYHSAYPAVVDKEELGQGPHLTPSNQGKEVDPPGSNLGMGILPTSLEMALFPAWPIQP